MPQGASVTVRSDHSRRLRALGAWIFIVSGLLLSLTPAWASPPSDRATSTVRGLRQPATLIIDHWGIAHIFAQTCATPSSCRATTPRATGSGRSTCGASAGWACSPPASGQPTSTQDRAARLFLYRGDMAAEWAAYGAGGAGTGRGLRRRRQRLCRRGARRSKSAAGGVQADREPARPLAARGRGAHPQPCAGSRNVPPRSPAPRWPAPPAWRRPPAPQARAGLRTHRVPGGPRSLRRPADVLKDYELGTHDAGALRQPAGGDDRQPGAG